MKTTKEENGITLVALVITIIILLILAGIAISSLTQTGLFGKANEAKLASKISEIEEFATMKIYELYEVNAKNIDTVNDETIKTNIKEELRAKGYEITTSQDKIYIKINDNWYELIINDKTVKISREKSDEPDKNENESNISIAQQIANNPKAYYGKKVENYKVNDNDTNTYKIFYVSTANNEVGDPQYTIYLKADCSKSISCSTTYDSANTKVRTMNPQWNKGETSSSNTKTRGDNESNWNTNEKAAAYLCSPVNDTTYSNTKLPWKEYYNSEKAKYVIGGPSVEMYVKSYNQAYEGITDINTYILGAKYRATNKPGYIYTLNGTQSLISKDDYYTGTDSLDYTKYNSMYYGNNGKKTGNWWLASPSANNSIRVCYAGGEKAHLSLYDYNIEVGLSPLIALNSSFIPQIEE